jgi:hypothetical protein
VFTKPKPAYNGKSKEATSQGFALFSLMHLGAVFDTLLSRTLNRLEIGVPRIQAKKIPEDE